jgi:hypothetical protein
MTPLRVATLILIVAAIGDLVGASPGPQIDPDKPITTCPSRELTPEIERLVRPVLLGFVAMRSAADPHSEAAYKSFEDPFYALLSSRDRHALEALVALSAYYLGEHSGEDLLESLLAKPAASDRLVAQYAVCRPATSFESKLTGVVVLRTKYDIYREERSRSRKAG